MPSNDLQTPSDDRATHTPIPPVVSEAGHGRLNAHPAQTLSRRAKHVRASLASFMPFPTWVAAMQPKPEIKRIWLPIIREMMALANLSADEERAIAQRLELDAATAAMETNDAA